MSKSVHMIPVRFDCVCLIMHVCLTGTVGIAGTGTVSVASGVETSPVLRMGKVPQTQDLL